MFDNVDDVVDVDDEVNVVIDATVDDVGADDANDVIGDASDVRGDARDVNGDASGGCGGTADIA